jgi:catecholate siderophore receptor
LLLSRLSQDVGLRINGAYENGNSFRNHVDLERYGINPVLGVKVGSDTRIDLSYEYFHDRRTADRGVPADGNEPLEGFDRTFFGDPQKSHAKVDINVGSFALEHKFSDALTLRGHMIDKFYRIFSGWAVAVGAELARRSC